MRITSKEAAAIRRVTAEVTGVGARVKLFGSRTQDDLRGRDIDLLIELAEPTMEKLAVSLRACARLQMAIGERKIDVLAPILRALKPR